MAWPPDTISQKITYQGLYLRSEAGILDIKGLRYCEGLSAFMRGFATKLDVC